MTPSQLPRRTGLSRGASRLAPGEPPRRRKGVNRESARTRARKPARRRCIDFCKRRSGGRCESAGFSPLCTNVGTDTHEKLTRARGGDDTDPANCLRVCRFCHDEFLVREDDATAAGYLVGRNKRRAAA